MSWIATTLVSLALAQPGPASPQATRAGTLIRPEQPNAAVVLLSAREAWSPAFLEGTAVCTAQDRCAPIVEVQTCEAPGCPFGFGALYRLEQDITQLQPLPAIDQTVLLALEQQPSLRPLIVEARARLFPEIEDEQPPPVGPAEPLPLPPPQPSPPSVVEPKPEPEPEFSGWNGTVGWSLEAASVPAVGVFFDASDDAQLALGGTLTIGFHHQFAMRPSRGPGTPKGAKRQRPSLVGLVGNNIGADLVFRTIFANGRPMFGIAAEISAGGVYNHFGDSAAKQHPTRLRVLSALDHLIPMPGLQLGPRGNPRLDIRLGGPVSILVRQRVAIHARLDVGFLKYGGPSEGYILFGVGVLGRKQLGLPRERRVRRSKRARRSNPLGVQ
ncbi:MAG: hypothetical protein K0V04_45645 [Deltaproteobacteria bacterium]|nr:hypothetical protein [Deltaproteobacteria bacterium]